MYIYNVTYSSPAENLAVDEYLLTRVNNGDFSTGICRLWESQNYFVVLGLSKKIELDVHFNACLQDRIPIFKRCSGGGTVLQGPGCFNYSYILPIHFSDALSSLTTTTPFILSLVQKNLSKMLDHVELKGISDLAINNIKFSGNAQRRLKKAILFHGTILYNFQLSLIEKYLKHPPIQPAYRENRPHDQFIQNIPLKKQDLCQLFSQKTYQPLRKADVSIPNKLLQKYQPLSIT